MFNIIIMFFKSKAFIFRFFPFISYHTFIFLKEKIMIFKVLYLLFIKFPFQYFQLKIIKTIILEL